MSFRRLLMAGAIRSMLPLLLQFSTTIAVAFGTLAGFVGGCTPRCRHQTSSHHPVAALAVLAAFINSTA
jgi:hypothetical protein